MVKKLVKKDEEILYKIVNKANKNTYFRYKDNYLEISKPYKVSESSITDYLLNNFDKFYKRYLDHLNSIPNLTEIILEDKSYKLIINKRKSFSYEIIDDEIIVNTNLTDIIKIKKIIYEKHLLVMLKLLNDDLKIVLNNNKIKQRPIKLKYFKTKFGSYHRKNNEITLNVILAKTNINYLYYVLLHEYAHTIVFNHSKKFYKVLETLMPNYKFYDKRIKNLSIWL